MSTPDYTPIKFRVQREYTLNEAVDLMKLLDERQTNLGSQIKWVDSKTKKPVTIGYNK